MKGVLTFFSTLWDYWKHFGQFLGDSIGRLFLMLFYLTIVLPFGLGMTLFSDPLDIKDKTHSTWKKRHVAEPTMENAYHQGL
ncbi:MAG: hypothetical protein IT326_03030 [Anaerolineae bacterium]|nr:hypothetical protein [Anaerolineae bacterium]